MGTVGAETLRLGSAILGNGRRGAARPGLPRVPSASETSTSAAAPKPPKIQAERERRGISKNNKTASLGTCQVTFVTEAEAEAETGAEAEAEAGARTEAEAEAVAGRAWWRLPNRGSVWKGPAIADAEAGVTEIGIES